MDAARALVLLGALVSVGLGFQGEFAQECRVYHLKKGPKYKTPNIEVHNLLTVSFYQENEGDYPKNIHIKLWQTNGAEAINEMVHINSDGVLSLGRNTQNFTLMPTCHEKQWTTLAVMLQDNNIIIYSTDDRENFIVKETSLSPNVTAYVTTSNPSLYVNVNCPAGCLVHNKESYLIGQEMPLNKGVNIYLSHEEGVGEAYMTLGFKGNKSMKHDITTLQPSLWHKLVIEHDKEKHVTIHANGEKKGEALVSEEDATFLIINSSESVLWSLHCYPDHATGLEGWGRLDADNGKNSTETEKESGAGVGQVLAWVLAGMALFLVMIMALLLCSKMNSRSGESFDYGASVGRVTSIGRQMNAARSPDREAEEDTEPDSPTYLAPVIHQGKVPEEEDEQQSNTKML